MNHILLLAAALLICSRGDGDEGPRNIGSGHRVVTLDCYYNNEWKQDSLGHRWRYHYTWADTLDSGYSQLGRLIEGLGGTLDTLCRPPTAEALSRTDIYLIVDPDTPKETDRPAFIDDSAASTLARWVSSGGTLLLFGNDSGNAEFVHLNRLASRFGITFEEDSRNKVVGKEYGPGTFSHLPEHPMFKGVREIYLKEISTLAVKRPAHPLLEDHGDIIIATAAIGRGLVFAVGDPWFYNEYMDHRRLPEGYDNAKTAENLFRWLFTRSTKSAPGH